jgi:hypothetical protein
MHPHNGSRQRCGRDGELGVKDVAIILVQLGSEDAICCSVDVICGCFRLLYERLCVMKH